ncbi:MAG: DnaJ domain-containing protein [Myxococcota bacterium]|jgi:DnaJ-domain-containing protein 1|nr:DnaJ domain-containing protein [Myxococcota bacterium]
MAPQTLKVWLIVAAAIYFFFPFDLVPDFFGLPGRIDDLGIIALLAWFYRNHLARLAASAAGQTGGSTNNRAGRDAGEPARTAKTFDAHQVLGVPRTASSDTIKAAYRARMQEYHPDKVAHLGEELQQLAHEKSQEIQRAYRQLTG